MMANCPSVLGSTLWREHAVQARGYDYYAAGDYTRLPRAGVLWVWEITGA
jgi:hypothetical protein